MKKYLLLRDNRQTGPYTIDDIRAFGLKPYDLVWVDGRSAAWRYPGEIDEFKSFAPPVEEQPYDRFYKKSTTENSTARNTSDQQTTEEKPRVNIDFKPRIVASEDNTISRESERQKPSPLLNSLEQTPITNVEETKSQNSEKEIKRPKYVSVSMPSNQQKTVLAGTKDQREVNSQSKAIVDNSAQITPVIKEIRETKVNDDSRREREAPLYPINSALQGSNQVHSKILQILAVAAGVISLVGVGILIGMGIGTTQVQESKIALKQPGAETVLTNQNSTPVNIMPLPAANVQKDTITQTLVNEKKPRVKKNIAKPASIEPKLVTQPVDQVTESKIAEDSNKDAEAKEAARRNLAKSISVYTNDYKVGMFGGIDDVKVTVNNNSAYPIDLVVVDVTYIQSNKKSYKTESLHFNDLAANSSITLDAPKANKGIKVKTSLTYITSKSLGISENIW